MLYYFLVFTVVGFFIQSFNKDDKKQALTIIIVASIIWGITTAPIWGFTSFLEMLFGTFIYNIYKSNSNEKSNQPIETIVEKEILTTYQNERLLLEQERKLIEKEKAELEKLKEDKLRQEEAENRSLEEKKIREEKAKLEKLKEIKFGEEKLKKKLEQENWDKWYEDYSEEIRVINKSRSVGQKVRKMSKTSLKEAYIKNVDAKKFANNTAVFSSNI